MSNTIIVKFLFLLLVADTVVSNCSNFRWANGRNGNARPIVSEWTVIDCRVKNNDNVDATLWLNQEKLTIDGNKIKQISKNKFNITNLQMSDTGRYYCKACGKATKPARIRVKAGTAFAIPEITKQPKTGVVKYGSTVILECSVFGSYHNYEMIWFKVQSDERHVKQGSTKQSIWSSDPDKNIQRQRLTIFNFNEDKADYYCQVKRYAVNHVGKATIQLHLEELTKPVISNLSPDGKLIVIEGNERVFNYSLSGTPNPDVSWYKYVYGKGEERITEDIGKTNTYPRNIKDVEITSHSFVIKNASYVRHNNVTYICRARNVKGHTETKLTIIVKTEPLLTPLKSEIELYKESAHLHCALSKCANPKNVSYSWAYSDTNVSDAGAASLQSGWKHLSEQSNTLKILNNQAVTIRLYRCTAENDIGTDQLTWTIVRPIGQVKCGENAKPIPLEKKEKADESSTEPIVIWQGIVAFLAILLLLTLFLGFHRRRSSQKKCETCFAPAMNAQIGCKV